MKPKYKVVEGIDFKWAPGFKDEDIRSALNYKVRPDDVFIVTYPKCGTTWMQEIVYLLYHNGEPRPKGEIMYKYSPFLEAQGAEAAETMPRPNAIKTHIPEQLHPYHPLAKYIIVARNPKDACVSFYYHQRGHEMYEFAGGSFCDFVRAYVAGEVECGDYCEFYLTWWPKIQAQDPQISFVLYEELKTDPRGQILKIAKFIGGQEMVDKLLNNEEAMLHKAIENSSFQKMQSTRMFEDSLKEKKPGYLHIRKGAVGDWKNHFSEEENQMMEEWFFRKTTNTGFDRLWDDYEGIFER